ncbi:MAG: D-aminoacyl-tRNA deacylase [Candidatus Auribacterota bacterium]
MKAIIQRVKNASVVVDGDTVGSVKKGLLLFLGIGINDSRSDAEYLSNKIVQLRVFEDPHGKMNMSLKDINGELLVISQFTLYGDCSKGRRPSFTDAMLPHEAEELYNYFVDLLKNHCHNVQTGIFGAHMDVALINDGPVTFIIESK